MSKRYGRQQKRKAKAKIEALQADCNHLETTIKIKNREVATAKYIIEIARNICPNSICFEPQLVGENIWAVVKKEAINLNPFGCDNYPVGMPIELFRIDLHQLELSLKESEFDRAIHYNAQLIDRHGYGRKAAYRISMEGFESVPVEHITNELARYLKQTTGSNNG